MMVLRLDPELQGRVDTSDVIQEGYKVREQHLWHLETLGRDVGHEVSIDRDAMTGASTGAPAARLLERVMNLNGLLSGVSNERATSNDLFEASR
jgi:RNA polymerase sigma-70 factor, ECF subfamily